jgi:hypothetical protein
MVTLVLLTVALRAPLLKTPFERDEGEYAYIAWRLGHGELPYRDWIDQKPPAIFWVYRIALDLPMDPIRAVHVMGMLFSAASAIALYFLSRKFMRSPWALAAAALFAVLSVDPRIEGTAANTELFMLLPLILSQWAYLSLPKERNPRRTAGMVATGFLTGIAAAFKQVAAVNWIFLIVLSPFLLSEKKRLRETLQFAFWSTLGAAVVWVGLAGYFAAHKGFGAFADNVLLYNLQYIHAIPWAARWLACKGTISELSTTQAVTWFMAVSGFTVLLASRRNRLFLFFAGWLITSFIGVSASGYFFPHYFQQLLPVLAIVAVIGARFFFSLDRFKVVPSWARGCAIAIALAALPAATLYPFIFRYTPAEAVTKIYPGNPFAEMPVLAKRLSEITKPDDRVFVFGAEPELLFYAHRVSATRYIFLFPLYGAYRDALEKQIATAGEITRAWPAAALYLPVSFFFLPGSQQYFTQWSQDYLRRNFHVDAYLTIDPRTFRPATIPGNVRLSAADLRQICGSLLVRNGTDPFFGK